MRLQQLIDGSGQSDFILLQDNKDVRGEPLIIEFIKQNLKLGNYTNLLCVEKNPVLMKHLPAAPNFNCHYMNECHSWLTSDSSDSFDKDGAGLFKFLSQVQKRSTSHPKMVLIIDSLALLLILYPEKCYRVIHSMLDFQKSGSKQCQIICLLHSDVVPGGSKKIIMFEKLASTNVYIEQHNKESQVTIRHRKASGRVIESIEQYYFDQSLSLCTKEVEKTKVKQTEDSNKDWMTKDVTFKLELEDEEKKARSELVLPYLKMSNKAKSAEIYYEPDANDDWDEEDPDDDLNI